MPGEPKVKPIVVLSGPVGAGKTAIAKELVACSPGPIACIEGDTFWFFIAKGAQAFSRYSSFKTVMRAMMAAAVPTESASVR